MILYTQRLHEISVMILKSHFGEDRASIHVGQLVWQPVRLIGSIREVECISKPMLSVFRVEIICSESSLSVQVAVDHALDYILTYWRGGLRLQCMGLSKNQSSINLVSIQKIDHDNGKPNAYNPPRVEVTSSTLRTDAGRSPTPVVC